MTEQSNFTEKSCKNMCGFFGTESTNGFCSVCYKKHLKDMEKDQDDEAISIRAGSTLSRQSCSPECLLSPSANACASMGFVSSDSPPTPQMILANRMSPSSPIAHGCLSDIKCHVRTTSKSPTLKSAHEVPPMSALKSGTGIPGSQESFDMLDNLQIDESEERYFEYHQQRYQRSSNCDECPSFSSLKAIPASRTDDRNQSKEQVTACDEDCKPNRPSRCAVCKRKLGLTGFSCRCGGTFCGLHRYSDKHECSFDYKEYGQREIRKNNPVVSGEKITKI